MLKAEFKIKALQRQNDKLLKENQELKENNADLMLQLELKNGESEKLEKDKKLVEEELAELDKTLNDIKACKTEYQKQLEKIREIRKEYQQAAKDTVKEIRKATNV